MQSPVQAIWTAPIRSLLKSLSGWSAPGSAGEPLRRPRAGAREGRSLIPDWRSLYPQSDTAAFFDGRAWGSAWGSARGSSWPWFLPLPDLVESEGVSWGLWVLLRPFASPFYHAERGGEGIRAANVNCSDGSGGRRVRALSCD